MIPSDTPANRGPNMVSLMSQLFILLGNVHEHCLVCTSGVKKEPFQNQQRLLQINTCRENMLVVIRIIFPGNKQKPCISFPINHIDLENMISNSLLSTYNTTVKIPTSGLELTGIPGLKRPNPQTDPVIGQTNPDHG